MAFNERSNYQADYEKYTTNVEGLFAARDCCQGQSLVEWGISEVHDAAREISRFLMGML